jgi:hypothetical protein
MKDGGVGLQKLLLNTVFCEEDAGSNPTYRSQNIFCINTLDVSLPFKILIDLGRQNV